MGVRIDTKDCSGDGRNEQRAESVDDMDAVLPQVRLPDECRREAHARLTAYGKGGVIVWMNVVSECWDGLHDYEIVRSFVCLRVRVNDIL